MGNAPDRATYLRRRWRAVGPDGQASYAILARYSDWAPFDELARAAGSATISVRGRTEDVTASELDHDQRLVFFRDVLGPVARDIPFGRTFIRVVDGVDLDDPVEAADGRPVFELRAR